MGKDETIISKIIQNHNKGPPIRWGRTNTDAHEVQG